MKVDKSLGQKQADTIIHLYKIINRRDDEIKILNETISNKCVNIINLDHMVYLHEQRIAELEAGRDTEIVDLRVSNSKLISGNDRKDRLLVRSINALEAWSILLEFDATDIMKDIEREVK